MVSRLGAQQGRAGERRRSVKCDYGELEFSEEWMLMQWLPKWRKRSVCVSGPICARLRVRGHWLDCHSVNSLPPDDDIFSCLLPPSLPPSLVIRPNLAPPSLHSSITLFLPVPFHFTLVLCSGLSVISSKHARNKDIDLKERSRPERRDKGERKERREKKTCHWLIQSHTDHRLLTIHTHTCTWTLSYGW